MCGFSVDHVRNTALVGHGASGKTTLADLMLFKAGMNTRAGSVDDGTSLFDFDEDEKLHKYSINSAIAHFEHNDQEIHILDTPGYPDFIGQAIEALQAVETAVIVVNAAHGLEVNTRRMFRKASTSGLGRMIVLNRMDSDNIDFAGLVGRIQEAFGAICIPMQVPVGSGANFSGVVSTLNVPDSVPDGVVVDPNEYSGPLMDAIVEADEDLMMRYFDGEEIPPEEIAAGVSKAIAAGTLIPIFCCSAKKDVGVSELMDALAAYALNPAQLERVASQGDQQISVVADPDKDFIGQVFQTRIDPFLGKMSMIRVFQGTLKKDMAIQTGDGSTKPMKIHQMMELQGGGHENVESAGPGDIVATVKMEELHVNHTLSPAGAYRMPAIPFPIPMIGLAVEPKSRADQQKISGALHKLEEEDPTFTVTRDEQTHEMVMHGMSELHLKTMEERLAHRDKVSIITHQPKIPYREAVTGAAEGSYRHKKQSGGSGQFAEVHLRVSACPRDVDPEEYFTKSNFPNLRTYHYDPTLNFAFVDRISGGSVPNQFIPAVEKGVKERMTKGVLAGYQMQDVVCELFFGKDHPVDSNETAFKTAADRGFREIAMQGDPVLLEPIVDIEITVPDDKVGDISGDLSTRRGRPEGMDSDGGFTTIKAKVPLVEVMTYARDLSSMTGGQGSYSLEPSHYETVPAHEQQKVIAAANHQEEED